MRGICILLIGLLLVALVAGTIGCGGDEASPTPTGPVDATPTPEPITLKLASRSPEDSPGGEVHILFADLVEEYTDGRVTVDIYPGSQLFPATEQWDAMVSGAIDIYSDSSYYISPYVPDVMVFYMDGVFESYEHAYASLEETEMPQIMAERVEAAGPVKMLGLTPGAMALCVLNTVREADSLEDLDGLKCQSSPGSPSLPLYEYTGMAAVPISYEETTAAYVQGVIDAVHFPPTAFTDMGLDEAGEHMLCRYSLFFTGVMIMNEDSWESLPSDIQDIIMDRVMPETYEFHKRVFREDEDRALQVMEESIETVHWVTEDELAGYLEYAAAHPTIIVQTLMIDPEILEIIEEVRPSAQ
jgi:TRAP-type C4-dicarboxylate transport system substrate-binding protein